MKNRSFHFIALLLYLILFASCSRDFDDTIAINSNHGIDNPLILRAKQYFEKGKINANQTKLKARTELPDTVDLFYALDVNWDSAKVGRSWFDSTLFVKVPVLFDADDVGSAADSFDIDMIFYDDKNH